jgi:hypothetical protein
MYLKLLGLGISALLAVFVTHIILSGNSQAYIEGWKSSPKSSLRALALYSALLLAAFVGLIVAYVFIFD